MSKKWGEMRCGVSPVITEQVDVEESSGLDAIQCSVLAHIPMPWPSEIPLCLTSVHSISTESQLDWFDMDSSIRLLRFR